MNKTTVAVTAIILIVVIVVSSYGVYRLSVPSDGEPQKETVTVVDDTGAQVNVGTPVERIVCLNPGLTEMICALGCEDRIVGRDANSLFPASISEKPIVGQNSYEPNLELLLEMTPDLVVADTMLVYNSEALKKIESAGVPVIIEDPSNVTRVKTITSNFGLILDKEEKANEIADYIESYENLVRERVKDLTSSEKPSVYIEWHVTWQSFAEGSAGHEILVNAGGINIAAGEGALAPTLSPEYVVEKNPDVIIRMISGDLQGNITEYQTTRNEILSRAGLSETKAVKEGKVYVYDPVVLEGIRYPVGLLYFAKWLHPSLFEDIDPAAIHEQLIQRFFGVELEGVYAYP
jgi:iron complex transport system substrate-binding protein